MLDLGRPVTTQVKSLAGTWERPRLSFLDFHISLRRTWARTTSLASVRCGPVTTRGLTLRLNECVVAEVEPKPSLTHVLSCLIALSLSEAGSPAVWRKRRSSNRNLVVSTPLQAAALPCFAALHLLYTIRTSRARGSDTCSRAVGVNIVGGSKKSASLAADIAQDAGRSAQRYDIPSGTVSTSVARLPAQHDGATTI